MSSRVNDGFKIYQKGLVEVVEADPVADYYEFRVRGSKGQVWTVYCDEGCLLCECPDFSNRNKEGCLACKHIAASLFKLAEIKGVKASQSSLMSFKAEEPKPIAYNDVPMAFMRGSL